MGQQKPKIETIYPLSPMQQGMLFHSLYAPHSGVYFEQIVMTLAGKLDNQAFKEAWRQVVARHGVLRTLFAWQQRETPLQVVLKEVELPWTEQDWRLLDDQEAQFESYLATERQQGFELDRAPLMRCALIRVEDERYHFVWHFHHLLLDGWSVPLLLEEVWNSYHALCRGERLFVKRSRPYQEYIKWLQKQDLTQAQAYWQQTLQGFIAPTPLVVDEGPPSADVEATYSEHHLYLSPESTAALQKIARENRLTLNTIIQGAWAILLSRYSGEEEVLFGATVSGRPTSLRGVERMVGLFINTLPVRTPVPADRPLLPWLSTLQEQQQEREQYAHSPLTSIQGWSDVPRGTPLFESLLVFENYPFGKKSYSKMGLELTGFRFVEQTNYPLTLAAVLMTPSLSALTWAEKVRRTKAGQDDSSLSALAPANDTQLYFAFNYDATRFERQVIERMAGHLQTLLTSMADNPHQSLAELSWLTEHEKHQLLIEFNDTAVAYPSDQCIHQLFEQQVERTPEAIAVIFADQQLTYRELNTRANQLAHHLIAQGVEPDMLVGLCVERSVEMVVGLLGILKAGGAYLPLDPSYPNERLQFMLDDAKVPLLLIHSNLIASLPEHEAKLLCLDTTPTLEKREQNPICRVKPTNLAYIIYTSGSTGKPKGVLITHQGLSNLQQVQAQLFELGVGDRVLQFFSLSFDGATFELVMALGVGATLYLDKRENLLPSAELIQLLEKQRISIVTLPPSALAALPPANLPALHTITVAGEACTADLVSRWGKERRFFNLYGPTETTIWATAARCRPSKRMPSIGRPIANTQVYILDPHQQLVPIGVPGELHVGGTSIAQGYLNRPQLTAEKFIANPFGPGKLYKTGDLCRYLPDGNLEFLGRADDQVKLRGFRIELGEISAALTSHPNVRQAVVVIHESPSLHGAASGKRLVAYVVPRGPDIIKNGQESQGLRRYLAQKLPHYMIPAAFVRLDAMPRLPNGKINRRALPAPEIGSDSGQRVLPRTAKEEILVAIWQEVLGVKVGIDDNFFEIGGHSLLATQIVSRIRQSLQVELPLPRLFSAPTIAELAAELNSSEHLLPPLTPLTHHERSEPLPLSFAQQRLWFLAQLEGSRAAYHVPAALRLDGPLDLDAFRASWQAICDRHEVLRTCFPIVDGQARQQISAPSVSLASGHGLEVIDLSELPAYQQKAEVASLSYQEGLRSFDLIKGPLWRVTLLRLAENHHVLLLTMHHIISDGWSVRVLIRELSALYAQKRGGKKRTQEKRTQEKRTTEKRTQEKRTTEKRTQEKRTTKVVTTGLTALPVQYADFAVWQRNWLQGEVLEKHLAYWKAQLADVPPLLTLPTDHVRPAIQSYRGATLSFSLPQALSNELKRLSQRHSATLFMTLQAAFAVLLSRYAGQEDILIGTPIANRQVAEIEHLIGFFVNTLVLRNDLSGNPTFADFLATVRQTSLDAYQHQALPFELLVETLQPERSLSHSPLFQVMFTLENEQQEALSFSDITVNLIEVEYPVAKFDLTLIMQEREESFIAEWEYNSDLFERATIERMAGHFQTLLEGIVGNPNQRVAHLPLLSDREKHQLLVEWNDSPMPASSTAADYPCHSGIHQWFEQQVARNPEAIAVIFAPITGPEGALEQGQAEQLTYRELNTRANQVAHTLIAQGVGPNVLVGLYVERSIEMIVGLLGILKAGGAYVPLDPSYPEERLQFMLEDAKVKVLLTTSQLLPTLRHDALTICLERPLPINNFSNPNREHVETQLAYVLYTSGSTGRAKGVSVTHRNLLHSTNARFTYYRDPVDAFLLIPSFAFDSSVAVIYWTLCGGGKLILSSQETLYNPEQLADLIATHQISHWLSVPQLYKSLLEQVHDERLTSLHTVIVAGEACPQALIANHYRSLPQASLFNEYGPTESTVWATVYRFEAPNEHSMAPLVSIGRAISNTQLYILDQYLQPVPLGVPGELHIGGAGLSQGYLNRPQLTSEKFITNPFCDKHEGDGTQLYKTGDLCRYLPDGNIEFLGRTDNQVKLRGFRIELGEIEAALNSQLGVQEAVVVVHSGTSGKQLVAYIVIEDGVVSEDGIVSENETYRELKRLRANLAQSLPDYMIPALFVPLKAMPLSPNGKIDRRALPAPDTVRQAHRSDPERVEGPRTPIEQILAAIWQDVLSLEQVGIHDNFFEIGGHSLLATQIVSRIRKSLHVELPLRRLFSAPTIAELATQLSSTERQLPPLTPLDPNQRVQGLPLSFAQQRLWFLAQLEDTSATYHISSALRLDGELNLAAFRATWQAICERHEVLRTTFPIEDGQARQQINAPRFNPSALRHTLRQGTAGSGHRFDLIDLSDLPLDQQEAEVTRLSHEESSRPFDLINGPLWRVTLLRLEEYRHLLLLTMSHIISDGWSIGVLIREFSALYGQKGVELPELRVQYADFAVWQREWLQGEVLEAQLAYWKAQLADAPPLLNLPTDHPRPAVQRHHGDHLSFTLPKTLHAELVSLSQQHSTTLFMTLQAAFAVLLSRYAGQKEVLIGTPIANRQIAEVEDLIGFFVNTLVLRNDLSASEEEPLSFADFLARVRQTALDAYQHQALPFELLVETLQPERSLSHSPLFQVMFILHNNRQEELSFSGLTVTPIEVEYAKRVAKFDLTLAMQEREEGLIASWEYNTDLFERATIERMATHFQTLLEGIVAHPEEDLAHLPLLSERERYQLLVEWNDTAADYPSEMCIHQLFEQQVERSPEAIAVVFGDQAVTYRELNRRANRVAHTLIAQGVGPDVLVGICIERSVEMLVGLLGILKAGGAYVPLDPSYPEERLAFMLSDSGVQVLLTQSKLVERLLSRLSHQELNLLCLDQELNRGYEFNPSNNVSSQNLAYCIYTSGSTGKPKGTLIVHRALTNYLTWVMQAYPVASGTGSTVNSSISFDATITSLFSPLLVGKQVILLPEEGEIEALANLLHSDEPLSLVKITPAHLEMLNQLWPSDSPQRYNCHAFIVGGEALLKKHLTFLQPDLPAVNVVNEYGPTETVVGCCVYEVPADRALPNAIPIGRPIANTQLYLLDEHLQPVPIGVPGELYIGGAGVARGYKGRPHLTKKKFIPNPFSPDTENGRVGRIQYQSTQLYKTGDLCRYLPDGNIEYLGRTDYQVKIRGFRIELGEIEAQLAQHEAVREVVVVVQEERLASGLNKRLVAYLVAQEPISPDALRAYLGQTLPDYMIPSVFVQLDTMPLTANGKIDRRALPAPETTGDLAQLVAPRTPQEEILAAIWQEVLGLEQACPEHSRRISIHDNFFELGGHSLLATQVVSRIRQSLQVELPLRRLFSAPTIAQLAAQLSSTEASLPPLKPLYPIERMGRLPLSFAQQRLWFLAQLEGTSDAYNVPAALRLNGPLDMAVLRTSWHRLCERHETLRTTFPMVDGQACQQINAPSVKVEVIDLSHLPPDDQEAQVTRFSHEEAQRPFDLMNGPLWRVTLLRLGSQDHVLFLTLHHIISDGWSTGILINEFSLLYEEEQTGEKGTAEALPVQYADFAIWQRNWLQGEVLEAQLAYWKAQLADAPPLLSLPTDHARPAVQSYHGAHLSFTLPSELTIELQRLAQKNSSTLFMTLQAAFAVLLSRYSGQQDILIGTPIANRQVAEVEHLIGFFVNTLVLRNDLSGKPSFTDLLARVRQTALDAYQHQALPFELLVEALQPERSLSHSPLFQVMFTLENKRQQQPSFSELTVSPIEVEYPIAKFDLTLTMQVNEEGLIASWEYSTDLFERATIERMSGHLQTLLEGIVANPDQLITHLPLLTASEREQLLLEWNATQTDWPHATIECVHQLFEEQAARTPEAIALILPSQQGGVVLQLTYHELNARANQLAHYLIAQGVGPDMLVGLCVPRSIEMIIGLFGILKAGGAYVPLDPTYPEERRRFMLSDSGVRMLLTVDALLDSSLELQQLCLDEDWAFIEQEDDSNPQSIVQANHLAYCIYTSGSTGQPKGVLIEQRNLLNFVQSAQIEYELSQQDRMLQFSSISFDTAVDEIYPILTCGGTLVLRNEEMLSVPTFWQCTQALHLTVLDLPTAYWHQLASQLASYTPLPSSVRLVIIGGERALPERLTAWQEHVGQYPRLLNSYGPTESTVVATNYDLSDHHVVTGRQLPIGRPVNNTQIYILDEFLQPVPIGLPGELHIGGAGLAQGYLNRPQLTDEKFIANPFRSSKLYKTGDLCRYLPDGNIEFLGRTDYQVKIRGFRIELGEIEAHLRQCVGVHDSVVVVREQASGKHLVAYVVSSSHEIMQDGVVAGGKGLRAQLAEKLPDYMIPSAFVYLEAMPLTPNGKIDRAALPAPDTVQQAVPELVEGHRSDSERVEGPRTPKEEILVAIWQELLGLEQACPEHFTSVQHKLRRRIGIHDNFFELGGHSLLATQVVSRIRQSLRVELPLRRLFSAPTIAELAAQLSSNEPLLPPLMPLDHNERQGRLPLSFAQQRLWFLAQFEGMNDVYHISAALRLSGPLDVAAFSMIWQEIEARHEVLRTTFPSVDGQAHQQINAPSVNPKIIDLSDWPSDQQESEMMRLVQQESTRPFDLINGPLWRVSLLRLEEESHVLLVTMHHIISDGWSIGVLVRELSALYAQKRTEEKRTTEAVTTGEKRTEEKRTTTEEKRTTTGEKRTTEAVTTDLSTLSVQYADFAVWQRNWLQGQLLETQLAYWKAQLADSPPLLGLPTDHARPAVQSYRGAHLSFSLPQALSNELKRLAQHNSATLFMTLQAAFAVLLSRYAGQEDILIGTPIANRQVAEVEDLIGFFVNTLVLRNDLSGNPTFRELLARVRQMALDAYQHQALPFELLVETLQPERSLAHSPLFQVMFILQNNRQEVLSFSDITVTPIDVEHAKRVAKFDLTLAMVEREEGLIASWEYNSDLFERATIERMSGHFQTLLAGIVANPDQSIARLPLLSDQEKNQLLVEWNQTSVPCPNDTCFHQLFEAQAARTPDAPALLYHSDDLSPEESGRQGPLWSYRELNERANQLAHYLRALGVSGSEETVVGVCMERCPETVISLLAIFKAGGVYIPLDPALPQERLAYMLTNSAAKVVLSKSQYVSHLLPSDHQAQVVYFDLENDIISEQKKDNPINLSSAQNLAYVIYTSGSTGLPKGAMVEQQGMVNHLYTKIIDLDLTSNDRIAETAPQSFDISIWQFLSALLVGGTVHIFADETVRDPAQLLKQTEREKITILEVVPSLFRFMLDELAMAGARRPEFSSLRWLLLTGEALPPALCREWFTYYPDIPLMNAYGPTECSDDVTHHAIYGPPPADAMSVPIGRAVPNMRLYILDRYLQPVPIGVPGEMYVGGIGVGRGYLNDPERTAKVFMDDPFVPGPDARFYKTGDLCRYLPDTQEAGSGSIEFLGRTDYQVKIRGFRIELGEIESTLKQCVGVRQAVVLVNEEGADKRLVAYIVGDVPSKAQLSERLPDYMIPAVFVPLDALPLTPNGKIDRHALPMPHTVRQAHRSNPERVEGPRTPKEEILVAIWQEVLGLEQACPEHSRRIGIHDNFFQLGGHSLLATQVVSRIRQSLQVELPLRRLFSAPTIAELAKQLHSSEPLLPPLTPLDEVKRAEPLPLSFAQQRLRFLAQLEEASDAYNLPIALRLNGRLDLAAFRATWQEIEARHEVLRTTFPIVDGQTRQQINAASFNPSTRRQAQGTPGSGHRLELIDLSHLPADQQETEVLRLAEEEGMRPFDLINGPLWRVSLLRLEEESHVLLVTMHHIISDGWSIGVLIRELSALYAQKRTEEKRTTTEEKRTAEAVTTAVTTLSVQYADFAVWQRDWLQGQVLQAQVAYWKAQLAGPPPLLTLPTDHARPAVQSYRGAHLSFMLPKTVHDGLINLSQKQSATLFMTLQAAFAVLLSRYAGQEDILIGTPIANRQVAEVEDLIGFFVNTLVLRNDLSGNPTFVDFLAHVRQTALDAYQHQALPFELLVETLQPERSLAHSPLFQVMFILQNNRQEVLSLADITISPIEVEYPIAKFDLTLAMEEQEEGLLMGWEYNTDLFERATIERMAGHFQILLEGIVANPDQSIAHLPLLSERETHQLLVEWNDTATDYPEDRCIHQLFEQQVAERPEAIAVVFGDQAVTYHELNTRANQLAHYLMAQGVGPDVLVGLCVERSVEMIVGLLGILKAGGAYVPLDPSYPPERLAFMLADTNAPLLLTQRKFSSSLPATVKKYELDAQWPSGQESSNPNPLSRANNLAYIMYTSGSTGRPKGVCVTQQNVVRLVQNNNFARLAADEVFLQLAPISFDASTLEIWGALLNGAKLVVMPPNPPKLEELGNVLVNHQISTLWLTAGLFHLMVDERLEDLGSVRQLLAGGDVLSLSHVKKVLQELPDCQLINGYGPTENTTFTTCCSLRDLAQIGASVPIGKPIANTQVYILDKERQPVPVGVVGELYTGGAGVARGYLNRPQLTAEKFIPNPFAPGRLYKTGDLCRYLPDTEGTGSGHIEFLGRDDHQVKLRGFRIELGEIESALNSQVGVQAAVVLLHEAGVSSVSSLSSGRGKQLVAYIVGEVPSKSQLKQNLPDYMIPSTFVSLDAMPLTPNGKINRRALLALGLADSDLFCSTSFMAPRNQTEQQLVYIWQEVLGLHSVGIQDSFFDLGGHSLLAVRLMAQIQQHFGVHLPLATLFERPTIEQLAIRLADGQGKADWSAVVPIQPNGDKLPFFCVPGVGGNVIGLYDLARFMGGERPVYGLQAVGLDGETAPYRTIEAIAAHNINAIQKIQPQGPYLLGGHSFGGTVAFEMAQQLLRAGHEVANLIIFDMAAPSSESHLEEASWDDAKWLVAYAETTAQWIGQQSELSYEELQPLDAEAQLMRFKAELERLNLWSAGFGIKQLRGLIQVLKTNSLINYVPHDITPTPITLFCAEEEQSKKPEAEDRTSGWQAFAKGPVNVISAPGNHISMMTAPYIEVLAKRLREVLR